jgi:pYEATS domain-containing protein involved in immunity
VNAKEINLEVKDSVFNPALSKDNPENKVSYRREGDVYYYKVWLYLDGYDLPYVESVTYTLDSSFTEPNQTVQRTIANPNCQLTIWTWALFTVVATITDKKGYKYQVSHPLTYKEQLPTDESKYDVVTLESGSGDRPVLVA